MLGRKYNCCCLVISSVSLFLFSKTNFRLIFRAFPAPDLVTLYQRLVGKVFCQSGTNNTYTLARYYAKELALSWKLENRRTI